MCGNTTTSKSEAASVITACIYGTRNDSSGTRTVVGNCSAQINIHNHLTTNILFS